MADPLSNQGFVNNQAANMNNGLYRSQQGAQAFSSNPGSMGLITNQGDPHTGHNNVTFNHWAPPHQPTGVPMYQPTHHQSFTVSHPRVEHIGIPVHNQQCMQSTAAVAGQQYSIQPAESPQPMQAAPARSPSSIDLKFARKFVDEFDAQRANPPKIARLPHNLLPADSSLKDSEAFRKYLKTSVQFPWLLREEKMDDFISHCRAFRLALLAESRQLVGVEFGNVFARAVRYVIQANGGTDPFDNLTKPDGYPNLRWHQILDMFGAYTEDKLLHGIVYWTFASTYPKPNTRNTLDLQLRKQFGFEYTYPGGKGCASTFGRSICSNGRTSMFSAFTRAALSKNVPFPTGVKARATYVAMRQETAKTQTAVPSVLLDIIHQAHSKRAPTMYTPAHQGVCVNSNTSSYLPYKPCHQEEQRAQHWSCDATGKENSLDGTAAHVEQTSRTIGGEPTGNTTEGQHNGIPTPAPGWKEGTEDGVSSDESHHSFCFQYSDTDHPDLPLQRSPSKFTSVGDITLEDNSTITEGMGADIGGSGGHPTQTEPPSLAKVSAPPGKNGTKEGTQTSHPTHRGTGLTREQTKHVTKKPVGGTLPEKVPEQVPKEKQRSLNTKESPGNALPGGKVLEENKSKSIRNAPVTLSEVTEAGKVPKEKEPISNLPGSTAEDNKACEVPKENATENKKNEASKENMADGTPSKMLTSQGKKPPNGKPAKGPAATLSTRKAKTQVSVQPKRRKVTDLKRKPLGKETAKGGAMTELPNICPRHGTQILHLKEIATWENDYYRREGNLLHGASCFFGTRCAGDGSLVAKPVYYCGDCEQAVVPTVGCGNTPAPFFLCDMCYTGKKGKRVRKVRRQL